MEIFFRILKSGCRVEALQLGALERLERALVIYLIIAWRILHLVTWGTGMSRFTLRGRLRSRRMAGCLDCGTPYPTAGYATASRFHGTDHCWFRGFSDAKAMAIPALKPHMGRSPATHAFAIGIAAAKCFHPAWMIYG